ncbi:MAG: hypothetical protein HUK26_02230 [Duodenibacillus sp.]|nr:hypothetical protein [Duodenibacillus sp.]
MIRKLQALTAAVALACLAAGAPLAQTGQPSAPSYAAVADAPGGDLLPARIDWDVLRQMLNTEAVASMAEISGRAYARSEAKEFFESLPRAVEVSLKLAARMRAINARLDSKTVQYASQGERKRMKAVASAMLDQVNQLCDIMGQMRRITELDGFTKNYLRVERIGDWMHQREEAFARFRKYDELYAEAYKVVMQRASFESRGYMAKNYNQIALDLNLPPLGRRGEILAHKNIYDGADIDAHAKVVAELAKGAKPVDISQLEKNYKAYLDERAGLPSRGVPADVMQGFDSMATKIDRIWANWIECIGFYNLMVGSIGKNEDLGRLHQYRFLEGTQWLMRHVKEKGSLEQAYRHMQQSVANAISVWQTGAKLYPD